ncbi:hypothetical protein CCR75_007541 [Bremia lactucae]|uniref:Uncharacterized protein n=1 Tax=Bremia lactucae TaxID=4779 RepID=A0A976FGR6_BRELC|nr:hypothetical protein CCR75_007541 [Bremia lactucae]
MTLASALPVHAMNTDAPIQRRLRVYAETSVESDGKGFMDQYKALIYQVIRFLPLSKVDVVAILNLVIDLDLSSSKALERNCAQLQYLSKLVKSFNSFHHDDPTSLFELLELEYGAATMKKMMESARHQQTTFI